MKAMKQHQLMRMYAVLTVAAVMVLGLGLMAAASDRNNNQGQYGQPGQNQNYDRGDQYDRSSSAQSQTRNLPLERQIAGALRQAGYGTQGEIMILATGNQVTLLGTVPSSGQKSGAEDIVKGVARGLSVKNRLHVASQAGQMNDTQLQSKINDRLSDDLKRSVQVSVQNGTATLQGNVNDWSQVADAIDAAFSAGASRVNSQFTVGTATAQAPGAAPSYGYIPGQQGYAGQQGFAGQQGYAGQPGTMGAAGQASSSDLRLAQQVASQLRQQLPPGQNVQLIQPQSIYVSVSQGTVMLHGYVQSNSQKQQAQQIVRSIRGVQNVRNDLTILSTAAAGGQMGGQQGFGGQAQYGQGGQQGFGGQSQYGQGGFYDANTPGQMGGAPQGFGGQSPYNQGGSYQPQGYIPGQSSQMGGRQAGTMASDMALARQVIQQLRQQLTNVQTIQMMRPGTIYVMASSGNVMLHGFITNANIKQQADQIAKAVPGVQNVTDRLRVIGGAGAYPSYGYVPGQGAQTQYIAQSGQMASSDMAIAQQVAQKLRQQLPGIQNVQIETPGTIYVKVANGTVTLDGFVTNNDAKRNAEQIAKSISGVQNVKNSLNIVGTSETLGYMPADEDQAMNQNQQFGNQFGNQQYGNEGANQEFGDEQAEDQFGADQP